LNKPDGFLVLGPEGVQAFLAPLPVSRIWGVGAKGEKRLHKLGIKTIGDLAATPERLLFDHLGEAGQFIWQLAHGRDDRPVIADREAKSVSTETTFARDIGDRAVLRSWLLELVEQLGQRLRQMGVRARTVELKLRSSDFRTHTRSVTLPAATDLTDTIWKAAAELFERRIARGLLPARLLGVGVSSLVREGDVQRDLFEDATATKQRALDQALDAIRSQFGSETIRRGGTLGRSNE